ncbi:hypothetical protein GVAV_001383 [Gurleya vavrai]
MIINRTAEFKKLRKDPETKKFQKIDLTESIRSKLLKATDRLSSLKGELERHCLPSFTNRKRKMAEIQKQKCDLNLNLLQIENLISHIEDVIIPLQIRSTMQNYFLNKLKTLLVQFRNVEENFLKKMNKVKIFEELDYNNQIEQTNEIQEMMLMKRMNDAEQIKRSIYFLTTMLMDVKLIVTSQTAKIDRIEVHMHEVEENIKATNIELKKIPKRHNKIKNRLIFILCACIIILIILSILKAAKKKHKFNL